mgnify:CR=1 FL=1
METGFKNIRWYKYSCINLIPIHNQGSIEFRHMHGTDDINKLVMWINLLQCLKIYAAENTLDDVLSEIRMLNSNSLYDAFMYKVFKQFVGALERTNLQDDMEECVVAVKQSTLSNEFHQAIFATIIKESSLGEYLYKKYAKSIGKKIEGLSMTFDDVYRNASVTLEGTNIPTEYSVQYLDGPQVVSEPQAARQLSTEDSLEIRLERAAQRQTVRIRI